MIQNVRVEVLRETTYFKKEGGEMHLDSVSIMYFLEILELSTDVRLYSFLSIQLFKVDFLNCKKCKLIENICP